MADALDDAKLIWLRYHRVASMIADGDNICWWRDHARATKKVTAQRQIIRCRLLYFASEVVM